MNKESWSRWSILKLEEELERYRRKILNHIAKFPSGEEVSFIDGYGGETFIPYYPKFDVDKWIKELKKLIK